MKKLKLLWSIFKTTNADKIIFGFLTFVFIISFVFMLIEPNINSYIDGLWYSFAIFTTIGFGDIVATTIFGKILSIILGLYGILVVALIPGILVSYFTEINKIKADDSITNFLDKLENLDKLSNEELQEISKKIKKRRYKL